MEAYSLYGFMNTNYGWDIAQEIEMVDYKNLADFILGGAFKQACMEHAHLNDETMCYINKDINNRMYTLLMHHYFD